MAAIGPIGKLESHDTFARRFGAALKAADLPTLKLRQVGSGRESAEALAKAE